MGGHIAYALEGVQREAAEALIRTLAPCFLIACSRHAVFTRTVALSTDIVDQIFAATRGALHLCWQKCELMNYRRHKGRIRQSPLSRPEEPWLTSDSRLHLHGVPPDC